MRRQHGAAALAALAAVTAVAVVATQVAAQVEGDERPGAAAAALMEAAAAQKGGNEAQSYDAAKQVKPDFDPLDYPVLVTKSLMCRSCYAAVKEIRRHLPELFRMKKKMSRELLMFDAIDHFCDEGHFMDYTGFPYEFVKGCRAFLDRYNDDSEVERRLVAPGTTDTHCRAVCAEVCAGMEEDDRHALYAASNPGQLPEARHAAAAAAAPADAPPPVDPLLAVMDPVVDGHEVVFRTTSEEGGDGEGGEGGGGGGEAAGGRRTRRDRKGTRSRRRAREAEGASGSGGGGSGGGGDALPDDDPIM